MLCAVCGVYGGKAQDIPTIIQTPNAAQISKFGDISVSYYTGQADVSIPLYSTEQRGVPLTVNLSYDTSGIRANSLPGWIGHGWTIIAGGVITRSVNGWHDEYVYPEAWHLYYGFNNYFTSYNKLALHITDSTNNYETLRNNVSNGIYDYSPDVYYFNFMGKSGRFFLGSDGEWHVLSADNIDVVFDIHNESNYIYPFVKQFPNSTKYQPKTIKGFTLVDDNGTRYIFGCSSGDDTSAIEYSIPLFFTGDKDERMPFTANSWFLSEVRDRLGNLLYKFEYERGMFIVQVSNCYTWTSYSSNSYMIYPWCTFGANYCSSNSNFPYNFCLNSPVYLKSINTINGDKITFELGTLVLSADDFYSKLCQDNNLYTKLQNQSTAAGSSSFSYPYYYLQSPDMSSYQNSNNDITKPLHSMGIRPLRRILLKSGSTNYKAYYFSYSHSDTSRLFLDGINIYDKAVNYHLEAGLCGTYKFTYYKKNELPNDYLTIETDHLGFYNGRSYNFTNIIQNSNFNSLLSTKEPELEQTKYGILTDIQYPTGGVTHISYELNKYKGYMSEDKQEYVSLTSENKTCGLRVSSIENYEDSTKQKMLTKRIFEYENGQLFSKPKYYWCDWYAKKEDNTTVRISYFKTVSILPMSNSFGTHIGYSKVTERRTDGSCSIYRYTNFSDAIDEPYFIKMCSTGISPFDNYSERGYKRGRLLSLEIQDRHGTIFSKTEFEYKSVGLENNYALVSDIHWVGNSSSASFNYFYGGVYKLFYPQYNMTKKTNSVLYGQVYVCDTTNYVWNSYRKYINNGYYHTASFRKCVSERISRGSEFSETRYDYPLAISGMTNQFFIPVISTSVFQNGNFIKRNSTIYGLFQSSKYLPKYETRCVSDSVSVDTIVQYLSYTSTGRLREYKEYQDCETKLFWNSDDKISAKLVGHIGNNLLFNESATDPINVLTDYNGKLPTTAYPIDLTTATYNYDGLISGMMNNNAIKKTYIYDEQDRLSGVKDYKGNYIKKYYYKERTGIR